MIAKQGVEQWHRVVRNMSVEALDEILADDVVFHSPVVHTPQVGRDLTRLYLMAAFNVFPGQGKTTPASAAEEKTDKSKGNFKYVREVVGDRDAVLEFTSDIDGITINGVDMIRWNDEGKIIDFKVMVRPLKAIQKIHGQMAAMLESMKTSAS
jgi:SnoaL-like domain